ncbi:MAG: methyltransferase family protein [Aeromicrobium sp.]|nr:methyltransferase family protein [Aeromicrobium sp.]
MSLRDELKAALPRANSAFSRLGVRVEPLHYYSNIADRRWLNQNPDLWQLPFQERGIAWDLDDQLEWLRSVTDPYATEVKGLEAFRVLTGEAFGPGYGPIESQVLHSFVRARAPRRVIEVGSGVSTAITRGAGALNAAEGRGDVQITCIEPFPQPALRELQGVELHETPSQSAPRELFERLEPGDLLFIDSTHAVRTGSELPFLYLDVIPGLPDGVDIHIHDIYLPYLFNPWVLSDVFDWQETVLLTALLTNNDRLSVSCSLSALHHGRTDELRELLPDYDPAPMPNGVADDPIGDRHFPSSTWLRTHPPDPH